MHSMDWKAVLSSEIAREYLAKEQEKKLLSLKQNDELRVFAAWENLQKSIKNNSNLLKIFSNLQKQFMENPENIKANPLLAKAVLAIDLENEEDSE